MAKANFLNNQGLPITSENVKLDYTIHLEGNSEVRSLGKIPYNFPITGEIETEPKLDNEDWNFNTNIKRKKL